MIHNKIVIIRNTSKILKQLRVMATQNVMKTFLELNTMAQREDFNEKKRIRFAELRELKDLRSSEYDRYSELLEKHKAAWRIYLALLREKRSDEIREEILFNKSSDKRKLKRELLKEQDKIYEEKNEAFEVTEKRQKKLDKFVKDHPGIKSYPKLTVKINEIFNFRTFVAEAQGFFQDHEIIHKYRIELLSKIPGLLERFRQPFREVLSRELTRNEIIRSTNENLLYSNEFLSNFIGKMAYNSTSQIYNELKTRMPEIGKLALREDFPFAARETLEEYIETYELNFRGDPFIQLPTIEQLGEQLFQLGVPYRLINYISGKLRDLEFIIDDFSPPQIIERNWKSFVVLTLSWPDEFLIVEDLRQLLPEHSVKDIREIFNPED